MIRAEVIVPIVLPTEKCVLVPLPDNYIFKLDGDAAGLVETFGDSGRIAQLVIHYSFDVEVRDACDPDHSAALVHPSKFVLVPFYVIQKCATDPVPDVLLTKLGVGRYKGREYGIYVVDRSVQR